MLTYLVEQNFSGKTIIPFLVTDGGDLDSIMDTLDMQKDHPFHLVLAISAISVACMCPLMSLVATVLFKNAGNQFVAVWLQTTVFNFPMAFFLQIFYAGPLVRFLFKKLFREDAKLFVINV